MQRSFLLFKTSVDLFNVRNKLNAKNTCQTKLFVIVKKGVCYDLLIQSPATPTCSHSVCLAAGALSERELVKA